MTVPRNLVSDTLTRAQFEPSEEFAKWMLESKPPAGHDDTDEDPAD